VREREHVGLQRMRARLFEAPLPAPLSLLKQRVYCARRYAAYDIYGLGVSLATSWAVLAASSPDVLERPSVYETLVSCASLLLHVRLLPAHPGGKPPCTGCSTAGRLACR